MSTFYVLSLGEFIREEGINIAMESFADLYQNVTSKHQKRMKFFMITKGMMADHIRSKARELGFEGALQLLHWSDQDEIERIYEEAAVLLLPSRENITKLVSEAFSYGLPVVCFDDERLSETMDHTCGKMIERKNYRQNIVEFSEMLRILYFDPEARKILKRGALNKYQGAFSWSYSEQEPRSRNVGAY